MALTVDIARLDALTPGELHDLFRLRIDVFVVEQNCPYPEIDGKDPEALHLRLLDEGRLAAYARIFAANATMGEARIGRVVVAPDYRGQRLGERIMREAIAACEKRSPGAAIAISAQAHLQSFYGTLGFSVTSAQYLEDGIPHVDMIRAAQRIAS